MKNITLTSIIPYQIAMAHMEEEKTFCAINIVVIPSIFGNYRKNNPKKKMFFSRVTKVTSKTGADFSHKQHSI